MRDDIIVQRTGSSSLIATHTVLRNTYLLLGLTLIFSAACAAFAMVTNAAPLNIFVLLIGCYGLMFLTMKCRNSIWGLPCVFAFTGFMGYTLGPILNFYLRTVHDGSSLIMTALGGTGLIFFCLSAYVLVTRKDFSFLANFLFVGFVILLLAVIASLFLHMPALQLGISALFMVFSSAAILFTTSEIIHNGERNYIMATISLYMQIFNLFLSLLNILSASRE
jgi:modulator of FtsH protease